MGAGRRPEHLKAACEDSLRRLGVDAIGLYQYHRPDPEVPFEESVGALRDLLDVGKIRLRRHLQRRPRPDPQRAGGAGRPAGLGAEPVLPGLPLSQAELDLCAELGIAFLPWSPLGGIKSAADLGSSNAAFAEVAEALDATPQQVALAWELAQAPVVVPIPGSSRPETIRASVAAADLSLSHDQLQRLDEAG